MTDDEISEELAEDIRGAVSVQANFENLCLEFRITPAQAMGILTGVIQPLAGGTLLPTEHGITTAPLDFQSGVLQLAKSALSYSTYEALLSQIGMAKDRADLLIDMSPIGRKTEKHRCRMIHLQKSLAQYSR